MYKRQYTAYLSEIPYIIVATAPSMDGFCSTVAALIDDGFKRTLDAKAVSYTHLDVYKRQGHVPQASPSLA